MKNKNKRKIRSGLCLLAAFVLWTGLVRWVDVQAIGPVGTAVGFATVNRWFHQRVGVQMRLYTVTDWLSILLLLVMAGFAGLGLGQWIRRGSIRQVDRDVLALGVFYLAVLAAYLVFEEVVVNYRPVLIDGRLEASYPSSTTLLVLCVMPTAAMQLRSRVKNRGLRNLLTAGILIFTVAMVLGRLLSGVHWLTDILGGILLSGGLVRLYDAWAGFEQSPENGDCR